jgi:Spy/CpxP family protein refolding chaperone
MMKRSKQQALLFLFGALLVGAVLGFSADRVFGRGDRGTPAARRQAMYDDLQLTAVQRAAMDSLLDQRHCQIARTLATVEPRLDSIRASAREQMDRLLTPDQRARLEARRAKWRKEGGKEGRRDGRGPHGDATRTAEACK